VPLRTEIVLSDFGLFLGRESRRLVVKQNKKTIYEIPADQVDGVYVLTRGAALSAEAIRAVVESGAHLTFFDRNGSPYAYLVSPTSYADAKLRARQIDAARSPHGLRLAKEFLRGKLANQAATLRYFAKSRRRSAPNLHRSLMDSAERISLLTRRLADTDGESGLQARPRLMAIESEAAMLYWARVKDLLPPDLGFPRRVRKGATDPANRCLNYGYGILYSKVLAKLHRASLDPYVGFMHAWQQGRAALLFDFVEIFRQQFVDRPVLGWLLKGGKPQIEDERLSRHTRDEIATRVLDRLNRQGRYRGVPMPGEAAIAAQARELAADLQGGPQFRAFTWPW